jgi:hypothetical protein
MVQQLCSAIKGSRQRKIGTVCLILLLPAETSKQKMNESMKSVSGGRKRNEETMKERNKWKKRKERKKGRGGGSTRKYETDINKKRKGGNAKRNKEWGSENEKESVKERGCGKTREKTKDGKVARTRYRKGQKGRKSEGNKVRSSIDYTRSPEIHHSNHKNYTQNYWVFGLCPSSGF